jgi:predicted nucleic acid-binding protein
MTLGVVDTTVPIHLLRNNPTALSWIAAQPKLAVTPISWMEIMYGAPGKKGQERSVKLLNEFEMVYQTQADMDWAMRQLRTYRLSHGVAIMDCLIASVCYRLKVPLYTHNVKDMTVLLGSTLVIKPYSP